MKTVDKPAYKSINTPICDFVKEYAAKNSVRLHMPGHKGKGGESASLDITEIDGADSLYNANGIIAASEREAGKIFGADTFYSCEGSSLSIRAMIRLIGEYAYSKGERPFILAGRNAHKSFLSAIALLDVETQWLYPTKQESYLSCAVTAQDLEKTLSSMQVAPTAVYITSPDYLGNIVNIEELAAVCHSRSVLLAVDNAHGAYLKFLSKSEHPIDLGADICADSAHKTLPALTGSAYLHVSKSAPKIFTERAKEALSLFGSTSPSYLILQSLDRLNAYLADGYREKLNEFCTNLYKLKAELADFGYTLIGSEPLKITVSAKSYGYTGNELAEILVKQDVYPEFYDNDFLTMMFTPEISEEDTEKLKNTLLAIPKKPPINDLYPRFFIPGAEMSPAETLRRKSEEVDTEKSCGRILAESSVSCPPAVPIVVAGEMIDESAVNALLYYGIKKIRVIK